MERLKIDVMILARLSYSFRNRKGVILCLSAEESNFFHPRPAQNTDEPNSDEKSSIKKKPDNRPGKIVTYSRLLNLCEKNILLKISASS
jgi:hypothetical protein